MLENANTLVIRIDKFNWAGETWFEAFVLFPDGRATSGMPEKTLEKAEKSIYRVIIDVLLFNSTPLGSFVQGSNVVESQIVEFSLKKLTTCCPLELDCTKMSDVIPCSNFKTCRRVNKNEN